MESVPICIVLAPPSDCWVFDLPSFVKGLGSGHNAVQGYLAQYISSPELEVRAVVPIRIRGDIVRIQIADSCIVAIIPIAARKEGHQEQRHLHYDHIL